MMLAGRALAATIDHAADADEVAGAASAFRHAARPFPEVTFPLVDVVGTGGDGFGTVNISTMSAIALAAAGIPIVKHGNRASTSKSGSADVLEAMGVSLDVDAARLREIFDRIGIAFLFANAWVVARREGVSLATLLPLLFGVAVAGWFAALPLSVGLHAPEWVLGAAMLLTAWGAWFFMSFTALLLYSTFYRLLPRKRVYDYIIIHGAGLNGEEPTPLLRGRIETAIRLWDQQGRRAVLVPSGGQGPDEVVSEAEAMHRFLRTNGVGEESILDEYRSTTTMENLVFAKQLIEERQRGFPYRCAMVTSDYHVFRTATYARAAGIRGDGVGAKTAFYYFPTAFIREFIAFTRKHWWPYAVIAALMLIPVIHRGLIAFGHEMGLF